MKRGVLFAMLGVIVLANVWLVGKLPPIKREQVPGISLKDIWSASAFVARVDGIRYGSPINSKEGTYDCVIIFLTKADGSKIGVIEYKPDLHTLESLESLKEVNDYEFPTVLLRRTSEPSPLTNKVHIPTSDK